MKLLSCYFYCYISFHWTLLAPVLLCSVQNDHTQAGMTNGKTNNNINSERTAVSFHDQNFEHLMMVNQTEPCYVYNYFNILKRFNEMCVHHRRFLQTLPTNIDKKENPVLGRYFSERNSNQVTPKKFISLFMFRVPKQYLPRV